MPETNPSPDCSDFDPSLPTEHGNATLPAKNDVLTAIEENESTLAVTDELRCSRNYFQQALWQYDIDKPDFWASSPQEAIEAMRGASDD